jgi:hypothetical protein
MIFLGIRKTYKVLLKNRPSLKREIYIYLLSLPSMSYNTLTCHHYAYIHTPEVSDSLVQVKLQAVTDNVVYPATLTVSDSGAFAYLDTLTNQQETYVRTFLPSFCPIGAFVSAWGPIPTDMQRLTALWRDGRVPWLQIWIP